MFDELMDEEFFTNEMKDKVVKLMDDPSKIVIATMKKPEKYD